MFSVEFSSERPPGAAPYYTLVVRDPYIVGSFQSCDIPLQSADIPEQHVALVVMRESQANRIADGVEEGEAEAAHIDFVRSHVTRLMETPVNRDAGGCYAVHEDDPLVVFLTVLPPQDEQDAEAAARTAQCCVRVGEVEVPAGSGTIVYDKSEVHIGADVSLIFHYRPLVVSMQPDDYSLDGLSDLLYVYLQLGATVCPILGGPAADISQLPKPIGLLHVAESLRNTPDCLVALAAGYSVVRAAYAPEWFAVVAQSAASPLSVLPPPSRFGVPVRWGGSATGHGLYLRPETDNCPFSLYPIPSSALRCRQRQALFSGKNFLFVTREAAAQYEAALRAAGGACYVFPEQTAAVRQVLAAAKQAAACGPAVYIVLDTETEAAAAMGADAAVTSKLGAVLTAVQGEDEADVPAPVELMSGAAIFDALLTNRLPGDAAATAEEQTQGSAPHSQASAAAGENASRAVPPVYTADDTVSALTSIARDEQSVTSREPIRDRDAAYGGASAYQAPYGSAFSEERAPFASGDAGDAEAMADPTESGAQPAVHQLEIGGLAEAAAVAQADLNNGSAMPPASQTAGSYAEHPSEARSPRNPRRASLLPRDSNRTPSRSQMRSLMRARASSVNSGNGSGDEGVAAAVPPSERQGSLVSGATTSTRGRRRLVSVATESPAAFTDRFDSLRLRIYAFLTKEDPKLDVNLVSMQRNRFVDDAVMEHTLEVKAQAQDYMELVDDLLVESTPPYTEALRRYWNDCCDLDNKAQRLISGHRRQSNAAGYRRPSFLEDESESMPNSGAAPVPHARSPRYSTSARNTLSATPRGAESRRRSFDSPTGSRTTTPRGTRREAYHSIAHNQVEDDRIDTIEPTTEPALLPPTPRTAAMQRAYGQQQHGGAGVPMTVTTRRRASGPATPRGAHSSHADPMPGSTTSASDRPSVPPVGIASMEGSRTGQSATEAERVPRPYRPTTPRQRTVGLEAPVVVRARSGSARRPTGDQTPRGVQAEAPRSCVQRAPAPIASSRTGTAQDAAPKRATPAKSRHGTPRGRYTNRRSASTANRPAWQY